MPPLRFLPMFAALLTLGLAPGAQAASVDPSRSQVLVQAPGLAPGVFGSAPIHGELGRAGAMTLRAPVSAVRTGNGVYDALLRRTLGETVTLHVVPVRDMFRRGAVRRFSARGTLYAAGMAFSVPLTVRAVERPDGTHLHSFVKMPLGPLGVRTLAGGDPGDVRASLRAFCPRR